MAMLEWDGKNVTINGVAAYDDPKHPQVRKLIDAVGWTDVGASLREFYFKVILDTDVCPECGGAFKAFYAENPINTQPIPGVETGWCIECKKHLLRTGDKVYTYPYGRCGHRRTWKPDDRPVPGI